MTDDTNLIVGAIDLYEWKDVKNWAYSIKASGYNGNILLLVYRTSQEVITNFKNLFPSSYIVGCTHDHAGAPINHNAAGRNTQCHQMRFFHLWQFLRGIQDSHQNFDNVIITDVRDVVFQKNPSEWLTKYEYHCWKQYADIIAPSEGIAYEDEPWGKENLLYGFGPYVYDFIKHKTICNIGTVVVDSSIAMEFSLTLYTLGMNRYIPNDQSGFNFLLNTVYKETHMVATQDLGWACQVGTMDDPTKPHLWPLLRESRPQFKDGMVCNSLGEPFVIVHQYDRNPVYKEHFERLYKGE